MVDPTRFLFLLWPLRSFLPKVSVLVTVACTCRLIPDSILYSPPLGFFHVTFHSHDLERLGPVK